MSLKFVCAVFVVISLLPNFNQADSFTTDPYLDSESTVPYLNFTNITIPDVDGIGTVHVTSVGSAKLSCPLTKDKSGTYGNEKMSVSTCVNLTNVHVDMPDLRLNTTIGVAAFNVSANARKVDKDTIAANVTIVLLEWNVTSIGGPELYVNISSKKLKNKDSMQKVLQIEADLLLKKPPNAGWLYEKLSELWPKPTETSTTFDFTSTTLDLF
ncbi:unnamed protein product [Mesocestoides corti]|uniref:Secreted protein n=1 Tax=Mesocestoides corti TaxID=53468 RepID=A0A0R3UKW2_MESCO|nr:unnamed protein product [Mesocestoides corti]